MKTTIKDVAKHAGVSVTSVSFVINGKGKKLKKETEDRILNSIEVLNYIPNRSAQNLSNSKTGFIALLVPDLTNPYYSVLAQSILEQIANEKIDLALLSFPQDDTEKQRTIKLLHNNSFDGALIVSTKFEDIVKSITHEKLIKFVLLDERPDIENVVAVTGNSEKGGYIAAEYLIENGHRDLACITGPINTPNSTSRLNGFLSKLNEESLSINEKNIVSGEYTYEGGYLAIDKLNLDQLTAIFCFNDLMAFGAITALNERGIRVPEDISILGYDNLPMNKYFYPSLSTIDQHTDKIGNIAINKLLSLIKSNIPDDTESVYIEPSLIKGKTVRRLIGGKK